MNGVPLEARRSPRRRALHPCVSPALSEMAKIIRAADTADKSWAPEGLGLEAIADGFRRIVGDDHDDMAKQFPAYDALYAYCGARVGAGAR